MRAYLLGDQSVDPMTLFRAAVDALAARSEHERRRTTSADAEAALQEFAESGAESEEG